MSNLLQDARFGTRIMLRAPVMTASIILVLALGIGANSAMFSIVDCLLIHPVSYPEPEKLAFVWSHDSQGTLSDASAADFADWRTQSKTLSDFAAWLPTAFVLTGGDRPRQAAGARVSANFFNTLRVKPELGRTFLPDEDGLDHPENAAHSAVISHRFWQEDLGADAQVLGRTIYVDSVPYSIVGVTPPGFQFWWRPHDIWIPVSLNRQDRDFRNVIAIARLRAPRDRAAAEMAVIGRSLAQTYPQSDKGWTVRVEDFQDFLLNRTFRTRLLLLSGAMGLVLLIACANVASLLLVRAAGREREIALRLAMGATPGRLARQLLTESALLSLGGGGLGLAFAWMLIHAAPAIVPASALPGASITLSLPVIWFALAISLVSCVIFGLAPALAVARADIQSALKETGRGTTSGRKSQRFRQAMIVAEAAVALVLLAGAGLMIGSFRDLTRANPGFNPKNLMTARLLLPFAKYDADHALQFYREGVRRIAAMPGVKGVAVASSLPLLNNMEVRFDTEFSQAHEESDRPSAPYVAVGPDYFTTLGIPLESGRSFTEADNETAPLVAVVSEELVSHYFPNQNPLGKRLRINRPKRLQNGEETVTVQIIGVCGNVKLDDPSADLKPMIYVPHPQNPWSRGVWFVARTDGNPTALAPALRAEFMAVDREQPLEEFGTLEERLSNQFAEPKFQTGLMISFALVALILAALGIYGVNAYAVAQRRSEIGLRMALGASRVSVMRQVVSKGMAPTIIGIIVGLAGAASISIWLRSALVGTRSVDPATFLGAALLLALVAGVACLIPAVKATRIDPAIALRTE
ncbi:MAG: ABC transporter permease [Acidobacteriota bacterium]|nr:ABC transporter permease [Acidobacteriota bacterium]